MDLEPLGMGGGPWPPQVSAFHRVRGWFVAAGVALVVLGLVAIVMPFVFTLAVDYFVGTLLVIGAVVHGVHAFEQRQWSGTLLRLLVAALYLVAGVIILARPVTGALALTLTLSAFLVAAGASRVVLAYKLHPHPGWAWTLVSGVLSVLLGAMLFLGWPGTAVWALGLLVGVDLLVAGWSFLGLAVATAVPAR